MGYRWLASLVPLLSASIVHAQVLRGTIYDDVSGDPILAASVLMLDVDSTVVASVRTGRAGEFLIRPAPGRFLLLVERYGYQSTLSKPLELSTADSLTFEIRLPPRPVDIAGLEVVAPPRNELDPSGFFQRQKLGWGTYIEPAEIERRKPTDIADLLRSIPGLRLIPDRTGQWRVRMEGRGRHCVPTVYLDRAVAEDGEATAVGFVPGGRGPRVGVVLNEFVNTAQVRAVEVYQSGAEAPPGFHARGGPGGGDCGVIVLWTYAGVGG